MEIVVEEAPAGSQVLLSGSITGMGPVQKGHLRGQVGALRNKIELAARESVSNESNGAGEISSELERLAGLFESGVLTDEEFTQAKARLLERG
ncbi:MAG: SHOCT domain-containing protein [Solirubrobacterales bacterium]